MILLVAIIYLLNLVPYTHPTNKKLNLTQLKKNGDPLKDFGGLSP